MKLVSILWFASFALASTQYYIVRRGIPSRTTRPGFRVMATAQKPGRPREPSPKSEAGVRAKGPASIYYLDADGKSRIRHVPEEEISLRKSKHPTRPTVGGMLDGPTSKDEPLKVDAKGRYASVSVIAPPGGSGSIKIEGDGGVNESKVKPGQAQGAAAHSQSGNAKAYASVSRSGEAHAIGFESTDDILAAEQDGQRRRHEGNGTQ